MPLISSVKAPSHCQKPCVRTALGRWQCFECGEYIEERRVYYKTSPKDESWPLPEEVYPPEDIYRYNTL